jgi:hypothetical protein
MCYLVVLAHFLLDEKPGLELCRLIPVLADPVDALPEYQRIHPRGSHLVLNLRCFIYETYFRRFAKIGKFFRQKGKVLRQKMLAKSTSFFFRKTNIPGLFLGQHFFIKKRTVCCFLHKQVCNMKKILNQTPNS